MVSDWKKLSIAVALAGYDAVSALRTLRRRSSCGCEGSCTATLVGRLEHRETAWRRPEQDVVLVAVDVFVSLPERVNR